MNEAIKIRETVRQYFESQNFEEWLAIECHTPERLGIAFKVFMEFRRDMPEAENAIFDYDIENDVFWVRGNIYHG